MTVTPAIDWGIRYYPCLVTLNDGSQRDRVYVVDEAAYVKVWGEPPMFSRDDREMVDLGDVTDIVSSPTRMPPRLASELYRQGESGMGYFFFGLRLRDGRSYAVATGGAVDFLPDGLTEEDVIDVVEVKRPTQESEIDGRGPHYAWCLYRDSTPQSNSTDSRVRTSSETAERPSVGRGAETRRLVTTLLRAGGLLLAIGGFLSAFGVVRDAAGTAVSWAVFLVGVTAMVLGSVRQSRRRPLNKAQAAGAVVVGDMTLQVRESAGSLPPRRPIGDPSRPNGRVGTLRASVPDPGWAVPRTVVSGRQSGGVFDPYSATGNVSLRDCELDGVSFRGIRFSALDFGSGSFTNCDFRGLKVDSVPSFGFDGPVRFTDCRFDGTDLRRVLFARALFERCSFDHAKIEWDCEAAEFVDCHFAGPIRRAIFHARDPRPESRPAWIRKLGATINEFRGNDFRQAIIYDLDLRGGIDVGAQQWPDGAEYVRLDRVQDRARTVRSDLVSSPPSADRTTMIGHLDILLAPSHAEQTELFRRRHNPYIKSAAEHALEDRLWELLVKA